MAADNKAQQELEQIERQVAQIEASTAGMTARAGRWRKLQERHRDSAQEMNAPPTAWQKTELARHPQRPQTLDYIERVFTDFSEIHGDRSFRRRCRHYLRDGPLPRRRDPGRRHAKGPRHEAARLPQFRHAAPGRLPQGDCASCRSRKSFAGPFFTLVDTDGAYPGIHAEERGQAEAIAYNLREMARLEVPIIATVIGVGGSGGALAIAVADRVLMMENSIYSVISPEGCAAIMWRDATKKELAAEAMRITATDLSELGCIDDIVPEPEGGAHRDYEAAANLLDASLQKHLSELKKTLTGRIARGTI